ncbi:MAG: hypothetical protein A2V66_11825 [Ignavibacteria bacterium RBG_13_36_8]|nr:MAG: hypothetical protein A2V66_11825 [Ignavibacteria bacterium RBG_13_36_8]
MEPERIKLYFILLRLKSFLVSFLDSPEDCEDNFIYTEEFLGRRYPDKREEIINMLREYDVKNDCEIAFDHNIQFKFRAMVDKGNTKVDLEIVLNNLEIEINDSLLKDKEIGKIRLKREEEIKNILASLFQLSKIWIAHKNLQSDIDDYSLLDEEDILRPKEKEELKRLGIDSHLSFDFISKLTKKYLDELIDFYFQYGGDVSLNGFVNELESFKNSLNDRYKELFKNHGLDPNSLLDTE